MIEGGKYHDSLEKLFILQNIAELKVDSKYSLSILDSKFRETWPKLGSLFIFCFGLTHLLHL